MFGGIPDAAPDETPGHCPLCLVPLSVVHQAGCPYPAQQAALQKRCGYGAAYVPARRRHRTDGRRLRDALLIWIGWKERVK
jgi:hypothetical protein